MPSEWIQLASESGRFKEILLYIEISEFCVQAASCPANINIRWHTATLQSPQICLHHAGVGILSVIPDFLLHQQGRIWDLHGNFQHQYSMYFMSEFFRLLGDWLDCQVLGLGLYCVLYESKSCESKS